MAVIFADIFKCIFFLNENAWIAIKFSLTCIFNGAIDNIPAVIQIKAWRRQGGDGYIIDAHISHLASVSSVHPVVKHLLSKELYCFPNTAIH